MQGTIRVYTCALRADSDYKTLFVNSATTCDDVIAQILSKFTKYRSRIKDPNLFFLSMDILTKCECECNIYLPYSSFLFFSAYHLVTIL